MRTRGSSCKRTPVEGLAGLTRGGLAEELGIRKAGVVGRFGSKDVLQLASLERANQRFREQVWDPIAAVPAGPQRLVAACEQWIAYLECRPLPGGCFMTMVATEWNVRGGRLRDRVVACCWRWTPTQRYRHGAELAIQDGIPHEKIDAFARARIGTPRKVELRVGAAKRDPAEAERLQDFAQHTVRQRWQYEMVTRRAGDFPADASKDH